MSRDRLTALESTLAAGAEKWNVMPARLGEIVELTARTSPGLASLNHWAEVHDAPEKLEALAASLDERL